MTNRKPLLVRAANVLGTAVGTYKKARTQAIGKRPKFFDSWASEGRWRQGRTGTERHAQRRAIQNSWVFTAIAFIARAVSAAKFEVVEHHGYDEEPTAVPNHPLETLLRRPNEYMGGAFLWQYTTWWIQLSGDGYWFILLDENNQPAELWPLPAEDVETFPGDDERFIDFYRYTVGGRQYDIPAELIVHMKLPNPYDIFRGMSPLVAATLPSDVDQAMAGWNANFFKRDNVMPSAVIQISSGNDEIPLDDTDVQALKDDLRTDYQAYKRKVAIIEAAEMNVELLGWNPKDLDFIEGRRFSKQEIYEIFGIPPGMLDPNATYANSENAEYVFTNKTLWPLLTLMAEQITSELVWRFYSRKYEATFKDVRTSNRDQELAEISASGPYLTIDEVRTAYWKLSPLPDNRGKWTVVEAQSQGMQQDFGEYEVTEPGANGGTPAQLPPEENPLLLPAVVSEAEEMRALSIGDDLRRWKRKSLNYLRQGKRLPLDFRSNVIPLRTRRRVQMALCALDELRAQQAPEDAVVEQIKVFFEGVELSLVPFEV